MDERLIFAVVLTFAVYGVFFGILLPWMVRAERDRAGDHASDEAP